jgi:arylsulfatase A-like enzyme
MTPSLHSSLRLRALLLIFSSLVVRDAALAAPQPNFIVILADDLGYGDIGCYGATAIATPRLDRMAAEGVRFTDFYVAAPFCSPSRAGLLTGRLPARCGEPYVLFPAEHTGLPPEEVTLAELLKPAGYATACVGKWHLGWRREFRPQRQGFDEYYGLLHTNDPEEWRIGEPFRQLSAFEPLTLREGDRVIEQSVDQATLTGKYTARALDFITRHRERPFFLYLPHTMPHVPQYASAAFAGKSKDGLYGDCIEELDHSTGQILDHLEKLGLAERTLVLFLSDNGANPRSRMAAAKKAPLKPDEIDRRLGGSNAPLHEGKGTTWEGGIRIPCIAWWPKTIAPDRVERTPGSTLDFFPTFAALAGATLPPQTTLDGIDLSRLLKGAPLPETSSRLLTHYFGVQLQAVREGPWKLILPITALPATRVPSLWFDHQPGLFARQHRLWPKATLYDLANDPGETTDLADRNPEIVARLLQRAQAFDTAFQPQIKPVVFLPGPPAPAPNQLRKPEDDLSAWKELIR